MCGIAGVIQFRGVRDKGDIQSQLSDMSGALEHRGPDGQGAWVSESHRVGFAHTRLSIIDLSDHAAQPMVSSCGQYVVTFNGELYNYLELREELLRAGASFNTKSDTEVLIQSYRMWGEECLQKFDGMFAFAIYDQEAGEVFLARDAFGEKPLYYMLHEGDFYFASELHAIRKIHGYSPTVDVLNIQKFLAFQYFDGSDSVLAGVRKLLPGSYIKLPLTDRAIDSLSVSSYFEFSPGRNTSAQTEEQLLDELEDILIRSVRRRLRADVPVGAFLSGGVDSSLAVAIAKRHADNAIEAYSIGFEGFSGSEHLKAGMIAKQLGVRHHVKMLSQQDLYKNRKIAGIVDEPNADTSLLPTYLLCEYARERVKVALSGDGADELFGGYGRYFATLAEQGDGRLLGDRYYSDRILVFSEKEINGLINTQDRSYVSYLEALRSEMGQKGVSDLAAMQTTDANHYLPGAVLAKVDRMSMANGLEVRTPFLSIELARFTETIPAQYLADGVSGKFLLKRLLERYLDKSLVDGPKKGFGLPMDGWGERLAKETKQNVVAKRDRNSSIFSSHGVDRWLRTNRDNYDQLTYRLWALTHLDYYLKYHNTEPKISGNSAKLLSLSEYLKTCSEKVFVFTVSDVSRCIDTSKANVEFVPLWGRENSVDWISSFQNVVNTLASEGQGIDGAIFVLLADELLLQQHSEFLEGKGVKYALIYDGVWKKERISEVELDRGATFRPPILFNNESQQWTKFPSKLKDLKSMLLATWESLIGHKVSGQLLDTRRTLFCRDTPQRAFQAIGELRDSLVGYYQQRVFEVLLGKALGEARENPANPETENMVFILPNLYPGGAERQACNLAVALTKLGKSVKVITMQPSVGDGAHYLPMLTRHKIEVIDGSRESSTYSLSGFFNKDNEALRKLLATNNSHFMRQVWPIYTHLEVLQPEAVVCFLDCANAAGGVAGVLAGVQRVALSFRNINPTNFSFNEAWYYDYYKQLDRVVRVTFTSNSVRGAKSYARWLGCDVDKVQLLNNCLDIDAFTQYGDKDVQLMKERLGLGEGPIILGVFRLSEEKNPSLFVDVIASLKHKKPSAKAVILGEGPLRPNLEKKVAELGLDGDVLILGKQQDVSIYMAAADIVLQLSRSEGVSNALLEAQYFNVPVVASPACTEAFVDGESGVVVDPQDPVAITEKICTLLDNPSIMKSMGESGRKHVHNNHSIQSSAEILQRIIA